MCDNLENSVALEETKSTVKRFNIAKKDNIFIILFFLSSFLVISSGIFGGFNLGFTFSANISTVILSLYLKDKESKIKAFPLICLILSMCISSVFLFTTNGSVKLWSFALYELLFLIWFISLKRDENKKSDLEILRFVGSPLLIEALPNIATTVSSVFSAEKERNKALGKVLLGILVALPVLLIIVPLLMSSDEAFSGLVKTTFSNIGLTLLKLGLAAVLCIFVTSFAFSLKKDSQPKSKESSFTGLGSTSIISFLSILSICYLSYLFSQIAYFFSGFCGFLPENYEFTASSYARRGFFEMSIIAAINFVIIFIVLLISKKKDGKLSIPLRIICSFIGLFTLIIIATALSKMILYIDSFGMTVLRITTSAFMIFLTITFISLIIRLYSVKINVIKTAFISAAILLILLGTVNVNSVVADYNYNAFISGDLKEIDIYTINNSGDEGIPILIKLADNNDYEISNQAKLKISRAYYEYFDVKEQSDGKVILKTKNYGIERFNIPRNRAIKELKSFLKDNRYILNYSEIYYNDNYNDIYSTENIYELY